MYTVNRFQGKVASIVGPDGSFGLDPNNRHYVEFLGWNAKQPVPLDLSDKPLDPPPPDTEREQLEAILDKADGDITGAEVKTMLVKFLRRQRAKGQL